MPVERYLRYYNHATDAGPFNPERCDAAVERSEPLSHTGRIVYQCYRPPFKNGLCKQHSKMEERDNK